MILLDWTRMGRFYCLAGAVAEDGFRIVRPLLSRCRDASARNVGWSPYLLDGHSRWELLELVGAEPATPEPPHLEDLWVRTLRPRRCLATPAQRREVLEKTAAKPGEPLFGVPLLTNRSAAYVEAGAGLRSLATLVVPAARICFSASWRAGSPEADVRVTLPVPQLQDRSLPVKDHHLLCRAEQRGSNVNERIEALADAVRQMGELVAVRLGLSRGFKGPPAKPGTVCWLMADGFFSFSDPQP
jgi:hypothetical protein